MAYEVEDNSEAGRAARYLTVAREIVALLDRAAALAAMAAELVPECPMDLGGVADLKIEVEYQASLVDQALDEFIEAQDYAPQEAGLKGTNAP